MGGVVDFVIRSTRWSALRRDRAYVADWGAHAGGSSAFVPAPFPLRTQTSADLDAARWGLLAWEDLRTDMPASPFCCDEAMPEGRFVALDAADPAPFLARLGEADATLTGLRLLNGALVPRIARGRKSGQVRLRDAAAVCAVAWPQRKRPTNGWRDSER